MRRLLAILLCLGLAACTSGCALCYTPHDDAYNAYGGVVPRHDMMHGRAGSILSDPTYQVDTAAMGDAATQLDLYPVETSPYLEEVQPQPTPADPEI